MNEELSLCPVTTCTVAPIAAYGAVIIRLDFLSHPMQPVAQAHPGRNYLLAPEEAKKLAQKIFEVCAELESGPPPGIAGPTH